MSAQSRRGSDSRCCRPHVRSLTWRDYSDAEHPSVVALNAWLQSLAPFVRLHEEGEIDDLMDAAERGELWDSGDGATPIKPIRLDPEIFELRRTALSKKLRFYHGEPADLPQDLIALHRHIKSGNETQQLEIEYAAERYGRGRSFEWRD